MGEDVGDDMNVAVALVRSAFLIDAVYAAAAREHGITPQQGQLLCVLMGQPYGMSDLGDVLGLAKSSLTGLVDRTQRRGLVRRVPDSNDQRAVQVSLTPAGSGLAAKFYARTCERVVELTDGLEAWERDQLAHVLGRVVRENDVPLVFRDAND